MDKNINVFFTRPHSKTFFDDYVPKISHHLNVHNIFTINKWYLAKYFSIDKRQDFLAYRFYLLKQWMNKNEKFTLDYVKKLDYLIGKLYLWDELNSFEQQWIVDIKDVVFAKKRNLKTLIVDFKTNKKEKVVFKYSNIQLCFEDKHKRVKVIPNCIMYLSDQRVIITKGVENFNINWSQIKAYHFSTQKITITTNTDSQLFISCLNNYILHVSFCRLFAIIKK